MTSSKVHVRKPFLWRTLLRQIGIALSVVLVAGIVGWGMFRVANTAVETVDESELEEVENLTLDEPPFDQLSPSATLTDVVPAVHHETNSAPQSILPVQFSPGERPSSNPSVWLSGTIEDATEPLPLPETMEDTKPQRFRRFSRQ